ncbi:glycosyltransferase family 4 protein [Alterisphingorhabdus coralli]|uniref:Glycosyltransferase family 1 protein n=1 Tax=Alterisphingorhabdus coralli TaxID=3071408 RepID=A0AA97F6G3_9SPHN|nr:glycosyltransferase family 1 protein [Parasphingorhabdus sp. SCSIO 66989]WOE75234.1 glycosyltransferase family 1 protein [Parasphingorhabdus sp. SCSIO 66989]
MRIALITDAWAPQMNGVVRTLQAVTDRLEAAGHDICVISPDQYLSVPCPSYPEIRLALASTASVSRKIMDFGPDAIHIATEGPLGLAARRYCLRAGLPFTTAYHTQFPDYVARRTGISADYIWPYIRWFHSPAEQIMVATPSIRSQLAENGLERLTHWGRGVDLACFGPDVPAAEFFADLPRPIQLYVGRVAVEKNIEAFLETNHPGSKVVVGAGPALETLKAGYPEAHFVGAKKGRDLASYYAGADVFVFPSRTDTFGLVMIEALASGTPVAAYPVAGPQDIIRDGVGVLDEDLQSAIAQALSCDRQAAARYGRTFSWETSAEQFLRSLAPLHRPSTAWAA